VLDVHRRLREDLQDCEPLRAVRDGFGMGRARVAVLARPLPIGHGLLAETRLSIVVRYQLRLSGCEFGPLLLNHLCDLAMILRARAVE
jgi:hypothetical protein